MIEDLTPLNLALALAWVVATPLIARFVLMKLALLGSAIVIGCVWYLGQVVPIGIGAFIGVLLAVWIDYRKRLVCAGCGVAVDKIDTLCEKCTNSFSNEINGEFNNDNG